MRLLSRPSFATALIIAAGTFLAAPSMPAEAQSSGYVNAVDLDIVPTELDQFMAAIKENAAATVQEPGCREFNITVLESNPNHVFLYEVYDDEAALQSHRATEHFKKYMATVANMVAKRESRGMNVVAMNAKAR